MKIKGFIAFSATALQYFGEKLRLALTLSSFLISNPKNIPIMLQIAYPKVYYTAFYKPKKCLTPLGFHDCPVLYLYAGGRINDPRITKKSLLHDNFAHQNCGKGMQIHLQKRWR